MTTSHRPRPRRPPTRSRKPSPARPRGGPEQTVAEFPRWRPSLGSPSTRRGRRPARPEPSRRLPPEPAQPEPPPLPSRGGTPAATDADRLPRSPTRVSGRPTRRNRRGCGRFRPALPTAQVPTPGRRDRRGRRPRHPCRPGAPPLACRPTDAPRRRTRSAEIGATLRDDDGEGKRRWRLFRKGGT